MRLALTVGCYTDLIIYSMINLHKLHYMYIPFGLIDMFCLFCRHVLNSVTRVLAATSSYINTMVHMDLAVVMQSVLAGWDRDHGP